MSSGSRGQASSPTPRTWIPRGVTSFARRAALVFAVDLRSLAAFRIGLAIATLVDLGFRSLDLVAHYTDRGVLPSEAVLAHFSENNSFSIHYYASVHAGLEGLVFGFHALAGLALLVGYRTRWATALCWYLGASLKVRNPLVSILGGDQILLLCLFWAMFLPLGARFSVDALRERSVRIADALVCVPGAALLLQVCFVYWATGLLKSGDLWMNGQAVYFSLNVEDFVTPFGVWLRDATPLPVMLTYGTLAIERLGPFLALSPVWRGPCRCVAVGVFWAFHLGLAGAMYIGLFPLFSMIAWLPFLPARFWEGLGSATRAVDEGRHRHRPSTLSSVVTGTLIAYVAVILVSHVPAFGVEGFLPRAALLPARALKLNQSWNMFAPDPPRTSAVLLGEARFANGESEVFPIATSARWRLYARGLYRRPKAGSARDTQVRFMARYFCREWAARRPERGAVTGISLISHQAPIREDGVGAARAVPVYRHACGASGRRRELPASTGRETVLALSKWIAIAETSAVVELDPPRTAEPDPKVLFDLARMRMPFGRYAGRCLVDLPAPYLAWFEQRGFPKGRLGELLQTLVEIKANGLDSLLDPMREPSDPRYRPPRRPR